MSQQDGASLAAGLLEGATERGERVLHGEMAGLVHVLEWVAAIVDIAAILVMVVGAVRFGVGFLSAEIHRGDGRVTRLSLARLELGRYILAGLELLIVSDIIHTALSLAFGDLLFLGLLVLIRATVSYFLDREIKEIKADLGK